MEHRGGKIFPAKASIPKFFKSGQNQYGLFPISNTLGKLVKEQHYLIVRINDKYMSIFILEHRHLQIKSADQWTPHEKMRYINSLPLTLTLPLTQENISKVLT